MTALFRSGAKTLLLKIHIQAVLNDVCWYARHIFMSSSKYVQVTPKKHFFIINLGHVDINLVLFIPVICHVSFFRF